MSDVKGGDDLLDSPCRSIIADCELTEASSSWHVQVTHSFFSAQTAPEQMEARCGTAKRIRLFLGEVDGGDQIASGGGVASEGEDIQIEALPLAKAMDMVAHGEIQDAKTIVALQHLALRRLTARDPAGA